MVYLVTNFAVLWLSAQFHNWILPLLGMPSSKSRFAFAFNRLLLFSVLCGLLSGVIVATYNHRGAEFVWIVPAIILAYKFETFPASLLENHFVLAITTTPEDFLSPSFTTITKCSRTTAPTAIEVSTSSDLRRPFM